MLEGAKVTINLSDLDQMRETCKAYQDLRWKLGRCGYVEKSKSSDEYFLTIDKEAVLKSVVDVIKDMHEFSDDDDMFVVFVSE